MNNDKKASTIHNVKAKSLIIIVVCFVVLAIVLFIGAYKFNILNFNKLRGDLSDITCESIPENMQPGYTDPNTNETFEYGFEDTNFFSTVVTLANRKNSSVTCDNVTKDDLATITALTNYQTTDTWYEANRTSVIREATNFNGIQYLTNLQVLLLKNNNVSSLDLTHNKLLDRLDLGYEQITKDTIRNTNSLTEIDLSENNALTYVNLQYNNLTTVNLTTNTNLDHVNVENNELTSISLPVDALPNESKLKQLHLNNNKNLYKETGSVDLSAYPNLTNLSLQNTGLTTLDLSGNLKLISLYAPDNKLTGIDLRNHSFLSDINLMYNNLNSLNENGECTAADGKCLYLPESSSLKSLSLSGNKDIKDLNLSYYTNLEQLVISQCGLTELDLTNNTKLTYISAYANEISKICSSTTCANTPDGMADLSGLSILNNISLGHNPFSDINLENTNLKTLTLYQNFNLTNLDLSTNNKLTTINVNTSSLESIELNPNAPITSIILNANKLTSIDVSPYNNLTTLNLNKNKLSSVDISHNNKLSKVNLNDNAELGRSYEVFMGYPTEIEHSVITNNSHSVNVSDGAVATCDNDVLKGLSIGNTTFSIVYDLPYTQTTETNPWHVQSTTVSNTVSVAGITSNNENYVIDYDNRTINVYDDFLTNVMANLSISDGYTMQLVNANEIYVTKNGESEPLGEPFVIQNYVAYDLTANDPNYVIDDHEIDVNGDFDINITPDKFNISPSEYSIVIEDSTLTVKKNDVPVDTYAITGIKTPVEDAYIEAGFNDENLYTCTTNSFGISKNYVLDKELKQITSITCDNKNIRDVTGLERVTNLTYLSLYNNIIEEIDLQANKLLEELRLGKNKISSIELKENTSLKKLDLSNNKMDDINLSNNSLLTNLDLSNNNLDKIKLDSNGELLIVDLGVNKLSTIDLLYNTKITNLYLDNNNLESIDNLDKLAGLNELFVNDNKLKAINLSSSSIRYLSTDNNLFNKTLYILKGKSINYDNKVSIPYDNKQYEVSPSKVSHYADNKLHGLEEGVAILYESSQDIIGYDASILNACFRSDAGCSASDAQRSYYLSNQVKVYDVTSKVYLVDKDKKVIDVKNMGFDANNIKVTLQGLTFTVSNNKLIIKDGDVTVDTFELINVDRIINKTGDSPGKKAPTVKKNDNVVENDVIEIEGTKVDIDTVNRAINEHKDVILRNDNVKFRLSYYDILKYGKEIDLEYIIVNLNDKRFKDGIKIKFLHHIPFKIQFEIELDDKLLAKTGTTNVKVYSEKLSVINSIMTNNKLSFTINSDNNNYLVSNSLKTGNLVKTIESKRVINILPFIIIAIILIILLMIDLKKTKVYKKVGNA